MDGVVLKIVPGICFHQGIIVKKEVYADGCLERGGSASHAGSHGRILTSVGRQEGEKVQRFY